MAPKGDNIHFIKDVSFFGALLPVDYRPSSLCQSDINEPSAIVIYSVVNVIHYLLKEKFVF